MSYAIRRATPSDAERVADLACRCFTETFGHMYPPEDLAYFLALCYTPETQREALEDPRCAIWLLEDGDEAIGHVYVGPCGLPHPEADDTHGEIKRLYILSHAHNGGWGAKLMQTAMDWLLREGPRTATASKRRASTCSRSARPTITNSSSAASPEGGPHLRTGAVAPMSLSGRTRPRDAGCPHAHASRCSERPAGPRHLECPALAGPVRAERLVEHLRRKPTAWLVGHSLGGLVILEALRRAPDLPVERVVCLGSPLNGSGVAAALGARPGLAWSLGRSRDLLVRGCAPWDGRAEVGVVAGGRARGVGGLLTRLDGPSDGTVAVSETRLPGIADHCVGHRRLG